ncbi:pullulanase X25 domain-containing protein [Croceimicrobium hydrocarbonivorans]|uniref:T9SS type A sorting domain-containing protein n=1 Tax=Croceimicrobium hydrocarbonivorans TaxID=2761580 RepID=A0A7H0VIT2_9FLAO|nr:T9SS type A sorting domain-containing protein [Croceimicrobium hydrocarbonivorans]QNR25630.1 T9SS type A sorting domain-containing protein [Croceimicrobium hydrocarbonivorans]
MKKIYTLALAMMMAGAAWAQRSVTFQVDMTGQTVSANGVHIAGDFQMAAGAASNWDPAATALSQVGATNIYEVTVNIPDGLYQYKFINGNAWGDDEGIPAAAQVSAGLGFDGGNSNRWVQVTGNETLAAVMYGGAAPAGMSAVSMVLDMSLEASIADTVSVAGDFQGWSPGTTLLHDILNDSMYRYIYYIPTTDTMNFKFLNGAAWGSDEGVPSACAVNNNRRLIIANDTVFGPLCYAQCGPCFIPDTFAITVQVDMSAALCDFDPATDSVDIAGPFNGWGATEFFMDDSDGDLIYDITLPNIPGPEFEYKARIRKTGISPNYEGGNNHIIALSSDTTLAVRCFGQASGACSPLPPPADVTFQVDMTNGPSSFVKVFLIGNFTTPSWQGGAIELTASTTQPGVFETTVTQLCPGRIAFKYMIEDGSGNQQEESFASASDTSCLEPSGTGDYNRFIVRTSSNAIVNSAPWEDCATVGIRENEVASLKVYPNPFSGSTTIELPEGNFEVKVYNLTGSLVEHMSNVEGKVEWNAAQLNSGIYIINVSNEAGFTATQKVVLK